MRIARPLMLLIFLASVCFTAAAQEAYTPIEQRLTPEQLRDTGLDRLSAEQFKLLNALLRDEHTTQVAAVREEIVKQEDRKPRRSGILSGDREPIVSKITGTFQGWQAGTRFLLANGQTWRVINTPEYYLPKSRAVEAPAVVVVPGLVSGFYMQVEGQGPRAKVQQVDD